MWKNSRLFRVGIIGSVIAAICCFTPLFVFLLGLLGFASLIGYLDYILFPVLAIFVGISIYAYSKEQKKVNGDSE